MPPLGLFRSLASAPKIPLLLLLVPLIWIETQSKVLTTTYRAFGPLPESFGEPLDPLSSFPSKILATLSTLTSFPSEIADGGVATWHRTRTNRTSSITHIHFPSINLKALISSYGIPGVSFFAYVVGSFYVPKSATYLLTCVGVESYSIISTSRTSTFAPPTHCQGDLEDAGYPLCPVYLESDAQYLILFSITGIGNNASFSCMYHPAVSPPGAPVPPLLVINDTIVPDIIRVKRNSGSSSLSDDATLEVILAGNWVSIVVMNTSPTRWLYDGEVTSMNMDGHGTIVVGRERGEDRVQVGDIAPQSMRALSIPVRVAEDGLNLDAGTVRFDLRVSYKDSGGQAGEVRVRESLRVVEWSLAGDGDTGMAGAPHSYRYTFLGGDSSVQYAAAVVPDGVCGEKGCAVVLGLHGAGVEAGKQAWTESYRRMKGAWVILPTGRRPFGFDWQGPMIDNAWRAVDAFREGLPGVPGRFRGKSARRWWGWGNNNKRIGDNALLKVDRSRFVFSGHSMGGHGCLVLLTHNPDLALGGVCAAGWLRLGSYSGWWMRQGRSFSDGMIRAMLRSGLEEFSADLYARNILGIPFLGRMGTNDESVPPWNMRRMVRVLKEYELWAGVSLEESAVKLSEVPDQGHWFGGVVDDDEIQTFLDKVIARGKTWLPRQFDVFTLNPATTGSRGGLRILQLIVPFETAKLSVARPEDSAQALRSGIDSEWIICSENVRRFRFESVQGIKPIPMSLKIDGNKAILVRGMTDFCLTSADSIQGAGVRKYWKKCKTSARKFSQADAVSLERGPNTSGPAIQVLSRRSVVIVYPGSDKELERRAVSLSNNLFVRGRYAARVQSDSEENVQKIIRELHKRRFGKTHAQKNLIVLGGSKINRLTQALESRGYTADVTFPGSGSFCISMRCFSEPGVGVAFLSGLPRKGLAYVVSGTDGEGLSRAMSFIPTSSRKEVPDWVVVSKGQGFDWKGVGGIIALGYWNHVWKLEIRKTYPSDFMGFGRVCSGGSAWRMEWGQFDGQVFGMNIGWIWSLGAVLVLLLGLKAFSGYMKRYGSADVAFVPVSNEETERLKDYPNGEPVGGTEIEETDAGQSTENLRVQQAALLENGRLLKIQQQDLAVDG